MRPSPYTISYRNVIGRQCWNVVWLLFYRPSPIAFHSWRCLLLRLFGAKVGKRVHPYPSSKVWAPWNLILGDGACLASDVDCYNVAKVDLGERAIVSQRSYLCTATHDYNSRVVRSFNSAHFSRKRRLGSSGIVSGARRPYRRGCCRGGSFRCRPFSRGLDSCSRQSGKATERAR